MEGRPNYFAEIVSSQNSQTLRNPLLFSVGVHLFITLIIFMPTSFFHLNQPPEIYSVELIDLTEPQFKPEPPAPPVPIAKPKPPTDSQISTKPILSTRTIPQTPTEIKILRPRKVKINHHKDKPPIDQTMVFAALQRMQKQEQKQLAQEKLDQANEAVEQANQEVLDALRESILARTPHNLQTTVNAVTSSNTKPSSGGSSQGGQRANTILRQYKATIGQHIHQQWHLPEGQNWNSKLVTTIIVNIKPDGIVTASRIHKASKSQQFDRFVIETIEKASPFPPFPKEVTYKPLMLHFYPAGIQ